VCTWIYMYASLMNQEEGHVSNKRKVRPPISALFFSIVAIEMGSENCRCNRDINVMTRLRDPTSSKVAPISSFTPRAIASSLYLYLASGPLACISPSHNSCYSVGRWYVSPNRNDQSIPVFDSTSPISPRPTTLAISHCTCIDSW